MKRLLTEPIPAELSPKTREATPVACDTAQDDPLYVAFEEEEAVFTEREREHEQRQRNQEFIRLFDESQKRERVWLPATEAV